MNIRIAKDEKDSIAASYIYAMSWKAAYKGIYSDHFLSEIPLDFWAENFNSNYTAHRFEVAIMNTGNKDVGAGEYGLSRDYADGSIGEITSIYFLQEAWGKGYSVQLMEFMVRNLKKMGCQKIHLWVLTENIRAQRFYEKYGFQRTGNEKQTTLKEKKIVIEYAL